VLPRLCNVLFLCTGNSARSILAEALLNDVGRGRFRAFSAGSHPAGRVNPAALDYLSGRGIPTAGLRSKSWDEFVAADTPAMDFVITVCDNAAGEACPVWPGRPMTAHWGVPDPAAADGTDAAQRAAFAEVARTLDHRVRCLAALPLASLDRLAAESAIRRIGGTAMTGAPG
jgi:arsenate reductase (thioredoxin)